MFPNNEPIGESAAFLEMMRTANLVSATDVALLINGEVGTGKKTLARHIHQKSHRKNNPFIAVNCAALDEELSEAVLFGGEQEPSNESQGVGYIQQANGGTLFLNNIAALSKSTQAKLQNFLATGEVQSAGSAHFHSMDVRIIAGSSKNLLDEVKQNGFQEDLLYRLNIVPIELPSLQERDGDFSMLMDHFFRLHVQEQLTAAPSFTSKAIKQLSKYPWPGNVRELKNFSQRMFILFSGKEVDVSNLPLEIRNHTNSDVSSPLRLPSSGINLDSLEVDLIHQALNTSSGNKSRAARLLGLTRDKFLYRLKKYAIVE